MQEEIGKCWGKKQREGTASAEPESSRALCSYSSGSLDVHWQTGTLVGRDRKLATHPSTDGNWMDDKEESQSVGTGLKNKSR